MIHSYAGEAWMWLSSHPRSKRADLADALGWPADRAKNALAALVKCGSVTRDGNTKAMRYTATSVRPVNCRGRALGSLEALANGREKRHDPPAPSSGPHILDSCWPMPGRG